MIGWSAVAIVAGFGALVWGADRFVLGAASIARNIGVSTLVVGLTIVGFGTSAPEMLVSAMAAWNGNSGMGVGNALGSNIANVGLVIGITAMIAPLTVHSALLRREFPILILIMAAVGALMADGVLSRIDGVILILGFAAMVVWMIWLARRPQTGDPITSEFDMEVPAPMSTARAATWFVVGLATLLFSSRLLVWGAVNIAQTLGVSDLVIGLTIVAIGTSLPELAAAVMSALKNEPDIALGNVIGSNMFNLLAVMAMPGLIGPGPFEAEALSRDYVVMCVLTMVLLGMAYGVRGAGRVTRSEGAVLLLGFVSYLGWLLVTVKS